MKPHAASVPLPLLAMMVLAACTHPPQAKSRLATTPDYPPLPAFEPPAESAVALMPAKPAAASSAIPYNGHLEFVFGDIKRSLAGVQGGDDAKITLENYRAIIDGLINNLHCNGLRIYIDPTISTGNYPPVYRAVVDYARAKGLKIYANPLATGRHNFDNAHYAAWIISYVNEWKPDFLGPFNEANMTNADYKQIAATVKSGLKVSVRVVGPDVRHVDNATRVIADEDLTVLFDIVSSHNAALDEGATTAAWALLQKTANKPTWATEDPRDWSVMNPDDKQIGTKAIVDPASGISGLVIYLAFPHCVDSTGALTEKGREIANGLIGPPPP